MNLRSQLELAGMAVKFRPTAWEFFERLANARAIQTGRPVDQLTIAEVIELTERAAASMLIFWH